MELFSWYCANTVPSLSLVISKIYDVRKQISEYFEYFESFHLNIQLEKGYQFRMLRSKFTKFLTFLKQQMSFSSNFTTFFIVMRQIVYIFLGEILYTFNKYQSTNLVKYHVSSRNFCTVMCSFCRNHIKFQLKKYRRVISHDTEK